MIPGLEGVVETRDTRRGSKEGPKVLWSLDKHVGVKFVQIIESGSLSVINNDRNDRVS